jgi:hypothetical protein
MQGQARGPPDPTPSLHSSSLLPTEGKTIQTFFSKFELGSENMYGGGKEKCPKKEIFFVVGIRPFF